MSQDVMGAVYERFLAHKLLQDGGRIVIEDTDELRKKEGIYYTPQYIVDYIVAHTLGEKIKPILAEAKTLLGYKNFKGAFAKIRELVANQGPRPRDGFRLVPAPRVRRAGRGLRRLQRRMPPHQKGAQRRQACSLTPTLPHRRRSPWTRRCTCSPKTSFGVDLDAQAVEVAKLNLWLRYMAVNRDPFRERLRARTARQGR